MRLKKSLSKILRSPAVTLGLGALTCGIYIACSPGTQSIEKSALHGARTPVPSLDTGEDAQPDPSPNAMPVFLYQDKTAMNVIAGKSAKDWFTSATKSKKQMYRYASLMDDASLAQVIDLLKKNGTVQIPVPLKSVADWADPFDGAAYFELSLTDKSVSPQIFTDFRFTLTPPSAKSIADATSAQDHVVYWTIEIPRGASAKNPVSDDVYKAFQNSLVSVTLMITTHDASTPTAPPSEGPPSPQPQ